MRQIALFFVLTLAACSETQFFAPPSLSSDLRVNVRAETVQINQVSVPEYAINQEIPIQQADGSLVTDTSRLWADLPDRALQASLMRHLNTITDAEVAVEPWPLAGFPEVELTVFVEDMIVQADNQLRFTGSYALRRETGRGRVEPFAISAPLSGTGFVAIIAAHEVAWIALAEQIAGDL